MTLEKSTQQLLEEELVELTQTRRRLALFRPHEQEQIALLKEREEEIQKILQVEDESRMTLAEAGECLMQGWLPHPAPKTALEAITQSIREDMEGHAGAELTPRARLELVRRLQALSPCKGRG